MRKVYDRVHDMRGNLITVKALGVSLGELARIQKKNGTSVYGSVLRFEDDVVTLQVLGNTLGISTGDKVTFLNRQIEAMFDPSLLGRRLDGSGNPIDGGPQIVGEATPIGMPSFNPVCRRIPNEMIRTNIPMIDVFNCLVKSQKIPIFSVAGEPYNELLMRIANQTDADVVVLVGMGLRFDDYQSFIDNAVNSGSLEKTVMFVQLAVDPPVECLLVPDMALAVAEKFALEGKSVLVLMTDMSAFANAIKEISITMDQIPANLGFPGSLYSDLASRYEKAVDIKGKGSITIVAALTMPDGDITNPIPDLTGYITEGQFFLMNGQIDPFSSLSRLKQLVIGHVGGREDHGDLANAMIRLYADAKKARELQAMGFRLSAWHEKLLRFSYLFEDKLMKWEINMPLEEALDLGWHILAECFEIEEVGIKKSITDKRWPRERDPRI